MAEPTNHMKARVERKRHRLADQSAHRLDGFCFLNVRYGAGLTASEVNFALEVVLTCVTVAKLHSFILKCYKVLINFI